MITRFILFFLLPCFFLSCSVGKEPKTPDFSHSSIKLKHVPLFVGRENPGIVEIELSVPEQAKSQLKSLTFLLDKNSRPGFLNTVKMKHIKAADGDTAIVNLSCGFQIRKNKMICDVSAGLTAGDHVLSLELMRIRCQLKWTHARDCFVIKSWDYPIRR